jgi:hypothetical protein
MSRNINENDEKQNTSSKEEKNLNNIKISSNVNELEEDKKYIESKISSNKTLVNNINVNYELNNLNNTNEIFNNFEQKDKIFKVNYRNIHDGDARDNIKQSIITNFINFFIIFINNIICKKLKTNNKIFHISYQLKSKIKIEDISELNVKQLLFFVHKNNRNEKSNNKKDNMENNYNVNQFNKYKNIISPSLDELFKTPVIDLFLDIYAKTDFKNQNEKEIDLKAYGVEGLVFKIDDDIPTYEKLKENYKDNQKKIIIMDDIKKEIINLKKRNIFKVVKK